MFYKSDWPMWNLLRVIKIGLDKKFDFVLVVAGDTGTGKSNWGLQLAESWQKFIGKPVNAKLIEQISVDKLRWLKKFKELEALDINVFDEGAAGLGSKQFMEKFSKTLEELFQVVRYKRFFTVIIVPNFFRLNKFFREDRLRGLLYVTKRGQYKYFTRKRVLELCQKNYGLKVKSMDNVRPAFRGRFPEYKGKLLDAYDDMKDEGVNNILDRVIADNTDKDGVKNKKIQAKEEKIEWWIRKMFVTGKITGRDYLDKAVREKFKYPYAKSKILPLLQITTPKEFEKAKKMVF